MSFEEGLNQYDSIYEEYEAKVSQYQAIVDAYPDCEQVKLYELLKKLEKNRDFKKLIGEIYLQQEAIKLTNQLAQPHLKEDFLRDRLMGISCLKDFFFQIEKGYADATEQVEAAKADIAFMKNELNEFYNEAEAE